MAYKELEITSQDDKRDTFSTPLNYDLNTPPVLDPPRIECHLDKETFIRHMVYIGTLHHDQLVLQAFNIWSQIPDLEIYDNIIDMRFHNGDVGWHTIKEVGKQWGLYFKGHPPKKRTAFVSNQATFTILLKAIQAFAPEHTFQVFPSKKQAQAWLQN